MNELQGNILWSALSGAQQAFAVGNGQALRYAPGLPPLVAFADKAQPDLGAIAPFCKPGEQLYCAGWSGVPPAGWQIDAEATMSRMVWRRAMPAVDEAPDALLLGAGQANHALALATLTRPGPLGSRTPELGEYFGYFEGERLIAMAGERLFTGALREISGVCTHPDFQGRGFARRLMLKLVRRQMQRRETPFLHVMRENTGARQLYERMGFEACEELVVRIVSMCG